MSDRTIIKDFQVGGILAQALSHFSFRSSQIKMAEEIQKTIRQQNQLVVEAGTGTGKTFAYLIPAIRSGRKIMISTASKALQAQLFQRDIPTLQQVLSFSARVVMLKGRQNYLCKQRLEQHSQVGMAFEQSIAVDLASLRQWGLQTLTGDISYCPSVSQDSPVWPLATSTEENCLGQTCPHYQQCFVVKARQQALETDIVIVNHHLFFADQQLQITHHTRLMLQAEVFIFDEAHTLPEIAAHYASARLSSQQLGGLVQDLLVVLSQAGIQGGGLTTVATQLSSTVQQLQQALSQGGRHRANWQQAWQQPTIRQYTIRLQQLLDSAQQLLSTLPQTQGENLLLRVQQYQITLEQLQPLNPSDYGYWYQASNRHFTIVRTPFSIAGFFQGLLQGRETARIFTSATLSVDQQLDHFCQRLGLDQPRTLLLPSPFNYPEQAMLYIPRYLPSPQHPQGADRLLQQLRPLLNQNPGGCLLLCTSYHRVHELAEVLRRFDDRLILVQGELSQSVLMEQFMGSGRAILVATYSFWQGIDIPGAALSCVIIDRLPFSHPEDPLLQARCAHYRFQGGDPFWELQVPEAVITLKQGIGRLIRSDQDRGLVIICDDRLVARTYGTLFLNSLPPLPRTRDQQRAMQIWS